MPQALKQAVAFEDVYVPGELARRDAPAADYLKEKRALQELAVRMIDAPAEVLPKFVELGMELGGGISAGLSIFEDVPGTTGVFRWHNLCGTLACFNGATTPRDYSPCGITLDQRSPVLTINSERMYDWISKENMILPEVLLIPLYIGGVEPLGTLWVVSDKHGHFHSGHARILTELAAFVGIALRLKRNENDLKKALANQETVSREMGHRVSNLFAMVQSIVAFTGRRTATPKEMTDVVSGRIMSLARAHALVKRGLVDHAVPRTADLAALIGMLLQPYELTGTNQARFTLDGIPVICGDTAINSLALVLHELATNAVKYGALSVEAGCIDIGWHVAGDQFVLKWRERGGPEISGPPARQGFGTSLSKIMVDNLQGALIYEWCRPGVEVTLSIPRARLSL